MPSFLHVTLHQTRDTAFAPETSMPHGHLTVTRSWRDTARPPVSSLVWPSSSSTDEPSCSPRDAISALAQAELSVWMELYEQSPGCSFPRLLTQRCDLDRPYGQVECNPAALLVRFFHDHTAGG